MHICIRFLCYMDALIHSCDDGHLDGSQLWAIVEYGWILFTVPVNMMYKCLVDTCGFHLYFPMGFYMGIGFSSIYIFCCYWNFVWKPFDHFSKPQFLLFSCKTFQCTFTKFAFNFHSSIMWGEIFWTLIMSNILFSFPFTQFKFLCPNILESFFKPSPNIEKLYCFSC